MALREVRLKNPCFSGNILKNCPCGFYLGYFIERMLFFIHFGDILRFVPLVLCREIHLLFYLSFFRCCNGYLWRNKLPPTYWLNTTHICPVSFSVAQEVGWFWLWVSHESQSACCQGCSYLKAWRGLEGPLPSWRSQRGFWLEATVPDHADLSTGLLKCLHNQSEWERARRKPWCLLSLIVKVTRPCFCSLQMHHIIQALFQGWMWLPFERKKCQFMDILKAPDS